MGGRFVRLLVVSDSDEGWPEDSSGAYDLSVLVRRYRPDALLSLGDFSKPHAAAVAAAGAPLAAGVYGNHCTRDYMPQHGITDLVGDRATPARHGTLRVPGQRPISMLAVQGCVRYKPDREDVLFTQKQYAAAIDPLPAAELVITHCPPEGINDGEDSSHLGIAALRRWMDRHRPRWLLHGHTYDNPPRSVHGGTDVLYVYGWAVVDLAV